MKEKIKNFFAEYFSVEDNRASNMEIRATMVSGSKLKGANMCILVLAIIIACVGLNMNSTATVIGAMLISPLMGCILGTAYGIATNDLKFAKKALIGLAIQILICMATATIYFVITPISTTSHELLVRTSPTIWDVLIAIAGGLAGIIGVTRKEKTNVIPGVAIATAIMPPLCTAGFGIATMQWRYFLGAVYLFFINAFFICISAVIVLRLMRIPKKEGIDEKRLHRDLIILSIVTILPSIYLGYKIVDETVIQNKVQSYINNEFQYEDTQVVSSEFEKEKGKIEVAVIGKILDENEILNLTNKLKDYNLQDMKLKITQTEVEEGISKDEIEKLIEQELGKSDKVITQSTTKDQTSKSDELKDKIESIRNEEIDINKIKEETKALSSKIEDCIITETETENNKKKIVNIIINQILTTDEYTAIVQKLTEDLGENITISVQNKSE